LRSSASERCCKPDHVSGETLILAPALPKVSQQRTEILDIEVGRSRLADLATSTPPAHPHPDDSDNPTNTANMPGVSVRDVQADKFINAYAAFLKRQGKLPIPGS
jgi:hypothetical protein